MLLLPMIDEYLRTEDVEVKASEPVKARRIFSAEFRAEVLAAVDGGLGIKSAARKFEVSVPSIYVWKRDAIKQAEAEAAKLAEANRPRGDLFRRLCVVHCLDDDQSIEGVVAEYEDPIEFVEEVAREREAGKFIGASTAYLEWWSPVTAPQWMTDMLAVIIQNEDGTEVTDPRVIKRLGRHLTRLAEIQMAAKGIVDDQEIIIEIEHDNSQAFPPKGFL